MPTLDISPNNVILKAREFHAKVAPFDEGDRETSDEQALADGVLENRQDDFSVKELAGFLAALNDDEKANLVAIDWIGRGTYEAEEWEDALIAARSQKSTPTVRYLLGDPLLSQYLEEGMAALGVDMAPFETEVASEG